MKEPVKIAISGVKNSGKTTLIEKLLPELSKKGIKTAVIKHDGHEFEADIPGTDSDRAHKAGAFGTAVFSDTKYLLVKDEDEKDQEKKADMLALQFPEADLILLEGFKNSRYPKLEVVRKENSESCVCIGKNLLALVSDFQPEHPEEIPVFGMEDAEGIAAFLEKQIGDQISERSHGSASCKIMLWQKDYYFGPGVFHLFQKIQETGSIRSAAMATGLSYTKACKMINRAEKGSGIQFLEKTIGGRNGGKSVLTGEGIRYLEKYQRLLLESQRAVTALYKEIFEGEV
ncbi:MAG: molybdopterin-guanine dinucleotide biosynthesis protein B [Lachnospiraceae bacterium]|nr:molybdopterin-guanine dinucleotide biosynthesis protein B [Lachnospiraceae bacterium]